MGVWAEHKDWWCLFAIVSLAAVLAWRAFYIRDPSAAIFIRCEHCDGGGVTFPNRDRVHGCEVTVEHFDDGGHGVMSRGVDASIGYRRAGVRSKKTTVYTNWGEPQQTCAVITRN